MTLPTLRRLRARLHPFEWFTYAMTLAVVVYLRWSGLRVGWRTLEYSLPPMFQSLPRALGLGLALHAAGLVVTRGSPRRWIRAVAAPASLLLWLRVWFAAMAMTYAYTWLKVCVPLLREPLLDPQLWRLDRILHFGISPSIFAVELVRGTAVAVALDAWYGLWVSTVLAALAYVFLLPDLAKRRNFALACAFLWTVGAWFYFALPAVGPCYSSPDVFAEISRELPRSVAAQTALKSNYERMRAGRDGTLKVFKPYLGVAALPSLHVGAHWLFALWARRHAPRLFLVFATATLLTLVAAVVTGWHYAVDGYLGMLLAWAAVRFADRFELVEESIPAVSEATSGTTG